jgi:hypothetical protein
VVASGLERVGQAAEDALLIVMDKRGLAVHDAVVAHHFAAEDVTDTLMAQAHAQNRRRRRETADDVVGNTRFPRGTRAGADDDVRRLELAHLVGGDFVVTINAHVDGIVQLAQALDQVVGERVVVVDEKDHVLTCLRFAPAA